MEHVAHVFPYDPRHLGQDVDTWASSQLKRWPLAAVASSRSAARSSVHVIGTRRRELDLGPLKVYVHPSRTSGPRLRDWGDDRSGSLERHVCGMGAADVCVIHLNDYPAARYVHRAAFPARVVLVFHGRGTGQLDAHVETADRIVVLRGDAQARLIDEWGLPPERVLMATPSVDLTRFGAAGVRQSPPLTCPCRRSATSGD